MPLRNPSTSHAESHTVASHSDTTATGAETETLTDGSNASALHVHTVVSLDTDTTGAELTSLADGSEVSIHSHAGGGAAPSMWVAAPIAGDEIGDYAGDYIGSASANGNYRIAAAIPTGFGAITKGVAVLISTGDGTMRYSVTTDFAAHGESRTANSDSIASTDLVVTADNLIEIDIRAALTGLAENDYLGLNFLREGAHANDTTSSVIMLGVLLEGTA
jgi:hypothetical protein